MRPPARFLQQTTNSTTTATAAAAGGRAGAGSNTPQPMKVDSDIVVILAALLCALICVVGLALAARCTWIRNSFAGDAGSPPPNKGLKKKALKSLPKTSFDASVSGSFPECSICLAEFNQGEEIRILPHCGHEFHVGCVDTWLRSHSTCPFCRRILVVSNHSKCRLCGGNPPEIPPAGEDCRENGVLP